MRKLETCKYKNLEMLRRSNSMTVDELMNSIGISQRATYYIWQKGGNIKIEYLIALHNLFGVAVDCLLDVKPIKS